MTAGWVSVLTPSKSIHSTDLAPADVIAAMASSLRGWSGRSARIDAGLRVAQVALGDGQPDLGGAAEEQDRLRVSHGVEDHLQQLQTSGHVGGEDAVGIDLAAHRDPLVDAWVHGVEDLGGGAGVLGGVEPAAELEHAPVEVVEELVEPRP